DLVVGTYGRALWVTNIVPLRGVDERLLTSDAALLPVRSFAERNEGALGNYRLLGDRYPVTANEPNGMILVYYMKDAPAAPSAPTPAQGGRGGFGFPACAANGGDGRRPFLTIADASGKVVCTLIPPTRPGMNQTVWNLNTYAAAAPDAGGRG